jgi:hypothetical protein
MFWRGLIKARFKQIIKILFHKIKIFYAGCSIYKQNFPYLGIIFHCFCFMIFFLLITMKVSFGIADVKNIILKFFIADNSHFQFIYLFFFNSGEIYKNLEYACKESCVNLDTWKHECVFINSDKLHEVDSKQTSCKNRMERFFLCYNGMQTLLAIFFTLGDKFFSLT